MDINLKVSFAQEDQILKLLQRIEKKMVTRDEFNVRLDEVITNVSDKAASIKSILVELQTKVDALPVDVDFAPEFDKLNGILNSLVDIDTTFPIGDGQ